MKLIIQIPCFNEELSLPETVRDLPRHIDGIDDIEILVIDDGSTDSTSSTARAIGVHHVLRFCKNQGLARAFALGLETSLKLGADIIVNTDGDNQYRGRDICQLIHPILTGDAGMVIGDRRISTVRHFSKTKKSLQQLGSWAIRLVSGTDVPDATSGFRAFSRDTALRLNVLSRYTYSLETIIQAARKGIVVANVSVDINPTRRKSRLIKSTPQYIRLSIATILRILLIYKAFPTFLLLGAGLFGGGFALGLRFLYFHFTGRGQGHIQSLILATILIILGFQNAVLAILANLLDALRSLSEDSNYRIKKIELLNTK